MRKAIVMIMALVILVASTAGVNADSGITSKTRKAGNGYITTIRTNGKAAKVKTSKRLRVKVIKYEKLTLNKITRRAGKYILIETISGKCINKRGDGVTSDGHYISYKRVKGHRKGAKYTTYLIYADNAIEDDITTRIDIRR